MNYNTFTLKSGLRVVHLPSESPVVYCGIAVRAGTRNEAPGEEGLAHFCEHLSFKGTRRRSAVRIINDIEGLGGELNAFTNKEDTVYYCAISADHVRRALDVLCDIVFDSQFPEAEIEKECEVVCDEIESYEDSPAELIYDEFENLLFEGHPLGHNILGTADRVRSFTQQDALRFTRRWYRPENCVLFISGKAPSNLPQLGEAPGAGQSMEKTIQESLPQLGEAPGAGQSMEKTIQESLPQLGEAPGAGQSMEKTIQESLPQLGEAPGAGQSMEKTIQESHTLLGEAPGAGRSAEIAIQESLPQLGEVGGGFGLIERHRSTHQAHVMIGARAFAATDPRRWALYLLNNILGGPGMNSRLNLSLRERHGLVYTVESSMVSYADTGLWGIYFGCDQKDVDRCRRLVRRELDRLADQPLSPTRLTAAKRQLQGQLAIASDSREQFALDFARNYLHTGTLRSLTDIMAHIDRLTADDLQQVARQLFAPEQLTTLIYS